MKPSSSLSPQQKKQIRGNLLLSAGLFVFYTLLYVIFRERIPFFGYFETAGTLLLITAFLHRFEPMYYIGILSFACFAQCGGVMLNLYEIIPVYDLLLHLASGILLVFMGHYFLRLLLRRYAAYHIPRGIVLWFCWLFAAASAGVWEIYEFTADRLFGLNCQLWTLGYGGLLDTMTDVIMGTCGALLGVVLLFLLLRKEENGSLKK